MIINSNLGSLLPRFRDIAGFFAEKSYSTSIPPVDQIADVVASISEARKQITGVINFEL